MDGNFNYNAYKGLKFGDKELDPECYRKNKIYGAIWKITCPAANMVLPKVVYDQSKRPIAAWPGIVMGDRLLRLAKLRLSSE